LRRNLAYGGATRPMAKGVSSVACLAFVVTLAIAFWAGVLWIVQALMNSGFLSGL